MNKSNRRMTFSKKLVTVVMTISLIDLQIPFVLAFLGRTEIAETLAISIVTEIVGVVITYSVKAFFETKEEEKNKLEREKMQSDLEHVELPEG